MGEKLSIPVCSKWWALTPTCFLPSELDFLTQLRCWQQKRRMGYVSCFCDSFLGGSEPSDHLSQPSSNRKRNPSSYLIGERDWRKLSTLEKQATREGKGGPTSPQLPCSVIRLHCTKELPTRHSQLSLDGDPRWPDFNRERYCWGESQRSWKIRYLLTMQMKQERLFLERWHDEKRPRRQGHLGYSQCLYQKGEWGGGAEW